MPYEEVAMNYTITEISDESVKVEFEDGSWANVVPTAGMSEEEFDSLVSKFAPKTAAQLDFISVGAQRIANEWTPVETQEEAQPENPQWLEDRLSAYGSAQSQIEYITENGLEAWANHVAEIKAMYPKS